MLLLVLLSVVRRRPALPGGGVLQLPNLLFSRRPVRVQRLLDVNLLGLPRVQEAEGLDGLAPAGPLKGEEGEVTSHHRSCLEGNAGIASVALCVVQVRKRVVCTFCQLSALAKATPLSIPVAVSFTHLATLSRISLRVLLLEMAAAKNSQSLFVYRCRLSRGSPYR